MPTCKPSTYRVITAALLADLRAGLGTAAAGSRAGIRKRRIARCRHPAGGTRPAARADRPLSGRVDRPDPHGLHLSARDRRGGALVKANPKVTGKALEDAMQKQSWDPAVKALTAVPKVLGKMNENLSWTQKLGDAFLADQKAVMKTVQALRAKAQAREPQVDTRADGKDGTAGRRDRLHHRVAQARSGLRAHLQPGDGLRDMAVSVSALFDVSPRLRLSAGACIRHGHRRGRRHLGQLQLGRQQRQRQPEQLQQLQQDQHPEQQLPAQLREPQGRSLRQPGRGAEYSRGGDAKAAQSREQYRGHEQRWRDRAPAAREARCGIALAVGRARRSASSGSRSGSGGGGFSGAGSRCLHAGRQQPRQCEPQWWWRRRSWRWRATLMKRPVNSIRRLNR